MKKLVVIVLVFTGMFLTSCLGPKTSDEIVSKTQRNIIKNIRDNTILSVSKGESNTIIDLNFQSTKQEGNFDLKVKADGQYSEPDNIGEIKIEANLDGVSKQGGLKADSSLEIKQIKDKLYFSLLNLNLKSSEESISAITSVIKPFEGKWYYIDMKDNGKNIRDVLKKVFMEEKYTLFTIVSKDEKDIYKNKIKFNKENFAQIISDIYTESDTEYEGNIKEDVLKDLENVELVGDLEIKKDLLHFDFSGSIDQDEFKTPLIVKYQKDKFYIELGELILNLNKKGYKFDGTLEVTKEIKFNIFGEATKNNIKLEGDIDKDGDIAKFKIDSSVKSKAKVEVIAPENAENFEETMKKMFTPMQPQYPEQGGDNFGLQPVDSINTGSIKTGSEQENLKIEPMPEIEIPEVEIEK